MATITLTATSASKYLSLSNATWSTLKAASTAASVNDDGTTMSMLEDTTYDQDHIYLKFNTTSLAGKSIESAVLNINVTAQSNNPVVQAHAWIITAVDPYTTSDWITAATYAADAVAKYQDNFVVSSTGVKSFNINPSDIRAGFDQTFTLLGAFYAGDSIAPPVDTSMTIDSDTGSSPPELVVTLSDGGLFMGANF